MADSEAFEFVCDELEARTRLDRLEARGTVRFALKEAGLEPRTTSAAHMAVVVRKLLLDELEARGIEDREEVCRAIEARLATIETDSTGDTPEDVFERLGR